MPKTPRHEAGRMVANHEGIQMSAELAKATLILLQRADIKMSELRVAVDVTNWLEGIMNGHAPSLPDADKLVENVPAAPIFRPHKRDELSGRQKPAN